jgi:hypothetical protein
VTALRCGGTALHCTVAARHGTTRHCAVAHSAKVTRCITWLLHGSAQVAVHGTAPHAVRCATVRRTWKRRSTAAHRCRCTCRCAPQRRRSSRSGSWWRSTCALRCNNMQHATRQHTARQDARCNKTRCEMKVQRRERLAALDDSATYSIPECFGFRLRAVGSQSMHSTVLCAAYSAALLVSSQCPQWARASFLSTALPAGDSLTHSLRLHRTRPFSPQRRTVRCRCRPFSAVHRSTAAAGSGGSA